MRFIDPARATEADVRATKEATGHHEVFNIARVETAERDVVDLGLAEERLGEEVLFFALELLLVVGVDLSFVKNRQCPAYTICAV